MATALARPPTPTVEQLIADLPVTELEKPDGGRVYLLGTAHTKSGQQTIASACSAPPPPRTLRMAPLGCPPTG